MHTKNSTRVHSSSPRMAVTGADDIRLRQALTSGGDERIQTTLTGRNKYGTGSAPQPDDLWFSSSTASSIMPGGYAAARKAFTALQSAAIPEAQWLDTLRARLHAQYVIDGAAVVLCASGTEAELLALHVARATLGRNITNIVIAPDETGSGVMTAASGRHFAVGTARGDAVVKGTLLAGFDEDTRVVGVPLRDLAGAPRSGAEIDADLDRLCTEAAADDRAIMLHVLDSSKTGTEGPSRATAARLTTRHAKCIAVVDACQLRCSPDTVRADLASGRMVMISGSKFASGPAFCGALLVPPACVAALRSAVVPDGLAAYSCHNDWPADLRPSLPPGCGESNIGLGLRWEAALFEIEAYNRLPDLLRQQVLQAFAARVEGAIAGTPGLRSLDPPDRPNGRDARSIFPVVTADGAADRAAWIYAHLRQADPAFPALCHVGQPVAAAGVTALRVCASMPMIRGIAETVLKGATLQEALSPVTGHLGFIFAKWAYLDRVFSETHAHAGPEPRRGAA